MRPHVLAGILGIKTSARRRWAKFGVLNLTESDYFYRTAVVMNSALNMFEGDLSALQDWLARPALALGQKAPSELLTTFLGLSVVEALIWRVEHGVVS